MGVLDRVWIGEYRHGQDGGIYPYFRSARLRDFPALAPGEWWELPANGPLVRKVRRYYPDILPVTDDAGGLVDVVLPKRETAEDGAAARREEAARRGYKRAASVRPLGVFEFLNHQKE